MYDLAQKSRQEDSMAGRTGNRADKPVSIASHVLSTHSVVHITGEVCQSISCCMQCHHTDFVHVMGNLPKREVQQCANTV